MPIPVKVHDNTSTINVKPQNNTSTICVKSGCGTEGSRLEALIREEKIERIEADENLQVQINEKQDKIKVIEVFEPEGHLDSEMLNLLISDLSNKMLYNGLYYTLMYKDYQYRRYQAPSIDPNILYTILVDVTNGHYIYSLIPNAELQNHINDNERHINPGEREFWNNKLNYSTDGEELILNRQ